MYRVSWEIISINSETGLKAPHIVMPLAIASKQIPLYSRPGFKQGRDYRFS
jgi:hypothetical protein